MRRAYFLVITISILLAGGSGMWAQETAQAPEAPAPPPPAPAAPAAAPAAVPPGPMVKEVKIIVDNKAKSNGEIHFNFAPAGGPATDVRVTVASGMSKKDVCRDIAKELTLIVGPNYKVDHYDDDKVKVEGKSDATFSLALISQNVGGISITLK